VAKFLGKGGDSKVIVGIFDGAGDGAAVRSITLEVPVIDGDVAVLFPSFDIASAFEAPIFRSDCRRGFVMS